MPDQLYAHVPFRDLELTLPSFLEKKLQPEIAFSGPDLDGLSKKKLGAVAGKLAEAGLGVRVHAPYNDLNPGAQDPLVLEVTKKRFFQCLEAAELLGAGLIVFHPGFDRWRYGGKSDIWLERNLEFWPPLLERAGESGCLLALENIFEEQPSPLADLLETLDSPLLGHCFDIGHWNLFGSVGLQEWFAALGPRTMHLHLHDNHGKKDDHLAVGEGGIDFSTLFSLLRTLHQKPTMTLEAHDEKTLSRSLAAVAPFLAS